MVRQLISALLLCATIATAEDYIIASGENGTDEAYVADKMVYTNWLADAVLWYPFPAEKLAGTYYDYSQEGNDCAQSTAGFRPSWTNGWGGAYEFDGVDDRIEKTVSNFRGSDSLGTIAGWVNVPGLSVSHTIFASADEAAALYYIRATVYNDGKIAITQKNNDATSAIKGATVLSFDTWYHFAITSDGSAYKIYLNGVEETLEIDAGTNTGDWFADTQNRDNFTLGMFHFNLAYDFPLEGFVDDLQIYSATMTSNQAYSAYIAEPTIANGGKR